jgi:hypothetical protein
VFTCQCRGGVCFENNRPMSDGTVLVNPREPHGELKLPIVLSAPVGEGFKAVNRYADVAAIQQGLDALLPIDRGFIPALSIDGICGPKTKAAIHTFQKKYFGAQGSDGLVEPGRQTIAKLNELLKARQFVPLTQDDMAEAMGLPPDAVASALKSSFSMAQDWIRAAHVRTQNPNGDRLMEEYFMISKQANPDAARSDVFKVYQLMNTFFLRPGGLWGEQAFQPEPVLRASETYAWCTPGGYFMTGQQGFVPVGEGDILVPMRFDTIYYTMGFVFMTIEDRAYAIVHELCHFIGRKHDLVYAHKDPVGFLSLAPAKRMQNCDHFALMAFESGTGRSAPPLLR